MKKIIGILIVFGSLFLAKQSFGAFYIWGDYPYHCDGVGYKTENDSGYQQCMLKNAQEQQLKESQEKEEKEKIYNEREKELKEYKDFFKKVGVSLTMDTTDEQYNQWEKELKEAKDEYLKEQENNQKIEDLENRIKELESKPMITEKIVVPNETVKNSEVIIKPIGTENKPVKKEVVKEETKTETQKENEEIQITQNSNTTKTTITDTPKKSVFKRVFGWFKSLF